MRDHTKLIAFRLADRLALAVSAVTRSFPGAERFGLTAQLRRGAVSVASNIVEGCARASRAEYHRFVNIAYGALRELEYQLSLARRLGFLEPDSGVEELAVEASKVLSGLVRSFHRPRQ